MYIYVHIVVYIIYTYIYIRIYNIYIITHELTYIIKCFG